MINKNSNFDDLIEEYINRMSELLSNTSVMPEDFFKAVDRDIMSDYKKERKLVGVVKKYKLKQVAKEIRQTYGLWARIKRALGLAPKLSEPSDATGPQVEQVQAERLTAEQAHVEILQKNLQHAMERIALLEKQQVDQHAKQSLAYADDQDIE